jgi:hypothetical protein
LAFGGTLAAATQFLTDTTPWLLFAPHR